MKLIVILFGLSFAGLAVSARTGEDASEFYQKGIKMTARGTFDVKVTPQPKDDGSGGPFDRLFLDKKFHGDLEGSSNGQMLATLLEIEGSGGYVALESVTGSLNGKRGSFVLQHKGTMRKGSYVLQVTVVPDSGTDQLVGISGSMTIIIEGGKHSYVFEYTLDNK